MKKRKFIEFDDYKESIQSGAQWSFGTASPFEQVSTPKALFVALAGTLSPTSGVSIAMGTMNVCRPGESDPVKFNFNQHVFYSTGTPSILEIIETDPKTLPYHWTNNFPSYIQGAAPEWVRNLLGDKFKYDTDSISNL